MPSKSKKEHEIISKNRDALLKEEQNIMRQSVNVETSFSSHDSARYSLKPLNFETKFSKSKVLVNYYATTDFRREREQRLNERESINDSIIFPDLIDI